ncbi:hypothetical protein [Streptomyces luteogriseus]|uniref:hypothetical protein n=1 Tax=Streptomyces luteogriseus TaxID=68233 RepID=UPI0026050279|nr:hypothetical protein [Streptomyces luteogriseus]
MSIAQRTSSARSSISPSAVRTDQGTAISWLTDRLEGKPTTSNCRTMPFQR